MAGSKNGRGGMHSWGCVWQGACVTGGYVWHVACIAGGHVWHWACIVMRDLHGRGHAWQEGHVWHGSMHFGGVHGREGAHMVGRGTHGREGACMHGGMCGRGHA